MRKIFALTLLFFITMVSKAKDIYVATNGNDHHSGTFTQPLASLKAAQDVVRKIKGPVTVYIRKGTYFFSIPLVFTPLDSRKVGEAVVYKNYANEKVTFTSGYPLQLHWQPFKDGIMKADVKNDILIDALYINENLQHMARYPNYNAAVTHYNGYAEDALSPSRIATWRNPEGGYIHALHQSEWGGMHYKITGKSGEQKLTMVGGYQNNRPSGMHRKYRFVENIFEELDTTGEWYFNEKEQALYLYPQNLQELNHATITAPQLETLIQFRGSSNHPVKNISIEGIELTQTLRTFMKNKEPLLRSDWTIYRSGAIVLEGTGNCMINDCDFNEIGGNAVVFSNYNRNSKIAGCHIKDAGASAIVFVGDPNAVRSSLFRYEQQNDFNKLDKTPGPRINNYPAQCTVYNNLIHDIGRVEKQVAGIQIAMAMNINVSHNTIYNVPRAGINIGDGTWGGHVLEYNDVFNTVLETGDHGSFNSWGRDRYWLSDRAKMDSLLAAQPYLLGLDAIKKVVIRNNRFRCDHGWDIDLDDGSSNYEIYNNVCLNGGIKLREGFHRKVYNNIIINNSFHPHVWFKNSGDSFMHNIVTVGYFPVRIKDWGDSIDYNFFIDETGLQAARIAGTDAHSTSGDALFTSAETGDYSVKKSSPALKIGFKNFLMNEFGVVSAKLKNMAMRLPIPALVNDYKNMLDEVQTFMGCKVKNLTTLGERSATGMASATGVLVLEAPAAGPLQGKVLPLDVILQIDDSKILNVKELINLGMRLQWQPSMRVSIFRNQTMKVLDIPLK